MRGCTAVSRLREAEGVIGVMGGVVTEFSDARGLGTITSDDGDTFLFHVVEIADGSRAIEVGRRVEFDRLPKFGTVEAGAVRKV